MKTAIEHAKRFCRDEHGTTAIEYGLIAALIATVCITAFSALGGASGGKWGNVANRAASVK